MILNESYWFLQIKSECLDVSMHQLNHTILLHFFLALLCFSKLVKFHFDVRGDHI